MTLDLSSMFSTATTRHDAVEMIVGGGPTTVVHDQTITNGETRLAGELGVTRWLAAGLILPFRVFRTSIRYLDAGGDEVAIENPFVHHHNETLTGVGDPWLYGRAATQLGGFTIGGRIGASIPLGRTVEDPFALGDLGIPHEHSQFGTGTVGGIAGVEVARRFGGVHFDVAALTIQTVYENGHGYHAGDRYAVSLGAASAFGTKHWRFRASAETVWETAERWDGEVQADDGNLGRTDVLVGAEATWLVTEDWHVGLSLKVPAYTHVEGGQLDALGFVGLSVGTHFHVFEGDDDDDHHHHDGDDHDHDGDAEVTPGDWSGLDKLDVARDGRVVPLEPVVGKITVFDFWATWCKPCRVVDHELAELARRHPDDVAVRKYDVVDVDSPASTTYLGPATLPHLKVFGRDGKLLWERSAPPLALVADVERAITGPRAKPASSPTAKRIAIEVTDDGYVPARIEIERGQPVTLVFTRRTDDTCATDVHFTLPDGTKVDEQLPLGTAVEIPLTVDRAGELAYTCGMKMIHGTIVVK